MASDLAAMHGVWGERGKRNECEQVNHAVTGSAVRRLVRSGVLVCVVGLGGALGTSVAAAAPSHAPSALSGTFACPNGETGTFVVNSDNAAAATTWNVAYLTFSSGRTGIFVPAMLDLTLTSDGQTFTSQATKGSAPSAITCTISAAQDGFTLSGVVSGTIVHNG